MVKIKPFRAIFYNQKLITDLSKVICPPYDVITPEDRKKYYILHPFNMINLILSKNKGKIDKYTHAKKIFFDWLNRRILEEDKNECFYLYEQNYLFREQKKRRLGFLGLLYLGDNKEIFGHEHTREEPKEDRFLLLKSVRANLCPIFLLFSNKKKILNSIYKLSSKKTPFIDIQDLDKVNHRLWRVDQDNLIKKLKAFFKRQPLFIADGHHRYEVSCVYRDLKRKEAKNFTGEEDFNYILAYFTDVESKGLNVLPVHRAIKKNDKILKILKIYFEIEEKKSMSELFRTMKKLSKNHIFGMYKDKNFFSLCLKKDVLLDKIIDKSTTDVQILNSLLKESNIGKKDLIYSQDDKRIIEAVDRGEAKIGFFLNPLKIEQILEISLKRERLPLKSSYFYPKLPSGLVINKFK